jgi:hypothetical protein
MSGQRRELVFIFLVYIYRAPPGRSPPERRKTSRPVSDKKFGGPIEDSGSHMTHCWTETDSNSRFRARRNFRIQLGWGDIFPLNETLPDGVPREKVGWREQAPPDSPTFKAAY